MSVVRLTFLFDKKAGYTSEKNNHHGEKATNRSKNVVLMCNYLYNVNILMA